MRFTEVAVEPFADKLCASTSEIVVVMPPHWAESVFEYGERVWKYPLMLTQTSL